MDVLYLNLIYICDICYEKLLCNMSRCEMSQDASVKRVNIHEDGVGLRWVSWCDIWVRIIATKEIGSRVGRWWC